MKHGGEMLQGVPGHHSQHSARFGRLYGQEHGGEECGVAFLHERGEAHASLSEWGFKHEAGEGVVEWEVELLCLGRFRVVLPQHSCGRTSCVVASCVSLLLILA